MTSLESSGLNAGYVGQLLEQYLENPEGVDPAWRAVFEAGDAGLLAALPGLERLVGRPIAQDGNGAIAPVVAESPAPAPQAPAPTPAAPAIAADDELVGGVAAAMSLVKAYRTHGHLNARL